MAAKPQAQTEAERVIEMLKTQPKEWPEKPKVAPTWPTSNVMYAAPSGTVTTYAANTLFGK